VRCSKHAFHPDRTARARLLALAAASRIPTTRVDEVLATVNLDKHARRRAVHLSLGQAQRLGIAAALLGDPSVLLLDEPANGLEPEGIRWLRRLLQELTGQGRTVFVSSHLIGEMAATADRVIVIGEGRMLADATVAELTARTGSLEETVLNLTGASS
jgi:ABC-2 type transport system ATP-binding protein